MSRDGKEELIRGETVVIATGARPINSLYSLLKECVQEIHLIGDAKSPRQALEAVAEDFRVGRAI